MARILIIDDEADIRDLLSDILADEGYDCVTCKNASGALETLQTSRFDVIILDIWLEGSEMDGIGVLKRIKNINNDIPVIMISGHGNIETAVETIKLGAYDFIEKPFKAEKLLILIKRAIETYTLKSELKKVSKTIDNKNIMEGTSHAITSLRDQMGLLAPTNSRAIIYGEPGTGKETLAQVIHNLSPRREEAYVAFVHQGLSDEDINNEIFGYEDKHDIIPGIFEKANKGTLFIDEVGKLSLSSQNKLLKVLQEQKFKRNGSTKELSLDVRIIVSSSINLEELVDKEFFSKSLYYRLNVATIYMPLLYERKDDIPALINSMNQEIALNLGKCELQLPEETIVFLQGYDWPGNIRQLRNVIEWLHIMSNDDDLLISIDKLPQDLAGNKIDITLGNYQIITQPLKSARDIFEKEYLRAQLSRFSGNISKTADFVGMERTALHRKLKSLKIANE